MKQHLLSFDGGKSSGIALLEFSASKPVRLVKAWQVENGVLGLTGWVGDNIYWKYLPTEDVLMCDMFVLDHVISEKFTPLQHSTFRLTMDSVEPLRVEGALVALDIMPDYKDDKGKPNKVWRRPHSMYLWGGDTLADKKKNAYQALKARGITLTGRDVGCKDANDARSAVWHGISYVCQVLKHKPSFDYWLGE